MNDLPRTDAPSVVVTTIAPPQPILHGIADGCRATGWNFVIIGDVKSPERFEISGTKFYGVADQVRTGLKFAELCPTRHYARKNVGYLLAMQGGSGVIVETDDDNIPEPAFFAERSATIEAATLAATGWVNVYAHFTDQRIWPRGLPLDAVNAPFPAPGAKRPVRAPIQQGLADDNPDVDAVYRLVMPLPITFDRDRTPVALGSGAWCPFNSQNTTWFSEAYPLMYLPAYCSFRMTDIWRSFVAQRVAWESGWHVLFHGPTVKQERNDHDLMRDFQDEVSGYVNNRKICGLLEDLPLKGGAQNAADDVRACWTALAQAGFVGPQEVGLVNAWTDDLEAIAAAR